MSLVVTVYVQEGIVMAADSRLTLNAQEKLGDTTVSNLAVGLSDSNYKLFLAPHGIGISTCGDAAVAGVPIAGYVESFIASTLQTESESVESVARALLDHFRAFDPVPSCQFHVAGYSRGAGRIEQEVWEVQIRPGEMSRMNPPGQQGASWSGESDIVSRLILPLARVDADGTVLERLPMHQIPWQFFTLQDAIDFAVFAIRSTSDAIRFLPRAKTVGGPIDVLVIKPSGAAWVQRKELRVDSPG